MNWTNTAEIQYWLQIFFPAIPYEISGIQSYREQGQIVTSHTFS